MRARLAHARAVEHHHPQRQQGGDTKRQESNGQFHPAFSRSSPPRARALRSGEVVPPVAATAVLVAAGMCSFWPICNLVASTPGFASMIAFDETPNFLAMVLKVS